MKASINGEERDVPEGISVSQLLELVRIPYNGIAVAKNDRVVPRAEFARERVADGDRIEIIKAVAGG